jgi:hypothetical protein
MAEKGGCTTSTPPAVTARSSSPFEQPDAEIGHPDRADLADLARLVQRADGLLHRRAVLGRPMRLVQIDPIGAQPAQRVVDLAPDRAGRADPHRRTQWLGRIAATDSSSSWAPQPKARLAPPTAHARNRRG